jgi:hypothetical protein
MAGTAVVLRRIVCHQTTESGHDEVFFIGNVVRKKGAHPATTDQGDLIGPKAAQGANAGGPGGDNSAWDVNDSGGLSDQSLNVELFDVDVAAGEHVVVTVTFKESDGQNLADQEAQAAAAAGAALAAVTAAFPPAAVVTAPVGLAIGAVSAVGQAFKSVLTNEDDILGSVTLVLEGSASGQPQLVQVGATGRVLWKASQGSPAGATIGLSGAGADYQLTLGVSGAVMQIQPTTSNASTPPVDSGPVRPWPTKPLPGRSLPGGSLPGKPVPTWHRGVGI